MDVKRCLIVDVETTGLDPEKDQVLELGAILYDLECGVLQQCSTLRYCESDGEKVVNGAESVNRISPLAIEAIGALYGSEQLASLLLSEMYASADVVVAHNAEFDTQWIPSWKEKPWLCTAFDFQWPHQTREGGSLINLALDHGIGVSSAHRALTDCQLIAALFDRMEPGA